MNVRAIVVAVVISGVALWAEAGAFAQTVGYDPRFFQPVAPRPRAGPPCGHSGTPPCPAEPVRDLDEGQQGSADDLFAQGQAHYGRGDRAGAMPYLKRAAELGNVRAQYAYGEALVKGEAVPRDVSTGLTYIRRAAAGGHRVAEFTLGDMYADGQYLPHDQNRAIQLYFASARQHFFRAELELGIAYELGNGVPRNRATAISWLDRSAADGQDGFPQQIASLLRRPGTPRFASENALFSAFGQARDRALSAGTFLPHSGGNPITSGNDLRCKGIYASIAC